MRIGEAATAAGVTVRAVRHYHRIGILAEPARHSNGYRDYALADVVRLLRIRWLTEAGVPLASVPAMLDTIDAPAAPPSEVTPHRADDPLTRDLRALVASIDARMVDLAASRRRLESMATAHRLGRRLSPLPAGIAALLDDLVESARHDDTLREVLVREREAWEMFAFTGTVPDAVYERAEAVLRSPDTRGRALAAYRRFAALEGRNPSAHTAEIAAVAEEFAVLVGPILVDILPSGTRELPDEQVAHAVPDRAQRAVVRAVLALLADAEPSRDDADVTAVGTGGAEGRS